MQVVFRVDASLKMGSGHVMRSLTLASELKNRNFSVLFICRILDGNLISFVKGKGFPVASLSEVPKKESLCKDDTCYDLWLEVPWQQDLQETLTAIDTLQKQPDWLIVDHYGLDSRWEEGVALRGVKLMVIDDLANRKHCCQVLLDQNFTSNQDKRYQNLIPESCHLLLGPRYALLREEFSKARLVRKKKNGKICTLFVFFGGVDASNETLKVLKAILLLNNNSLNVDVLVGAQNPHKDVIREFCERSPFLHFHFQPDSVADLMINADLAIGAGGTFSWERCTLGIPTLAWPIAENQKELLYYASRQGAVYVPDEQSINSVEGVLCHLLALMNNSNLCRLMSLHALKLCDGHGVGRVANVLDDPTIIIREAVIGDCDTVYRWRNNVIIRKFSSNSQKIPLSEHRCWFAASLEANDRILLIGEEMGQAIGVVRFDLVGSAAKVSIFLEPEMIGKGRGKYLLRASEDWLKTNVPSVETVKAEVLNSNKASSYMFEHVGYECHSKMYNKQLTS